MSEVTFEAATVQDALEQAAAQFGTEQDQLDYEVVEEKADFWGTGAGTIVIKAWARAEPEPEPEPEAEAEAAEEVADRSIAAVPGDAVAEAPIEASPPEDPVERAEAPAAGGFWSGGDSAAAGPETTTAPVETEAEPAESPAAPGAAEPAAEMPEVTVDPPAVAPAEPEAGSQGPQDDTGDAPEVDGGAIVALLEQIFHDMEFDCTVEVESQADGFLATVAGADKELVVEGNGRCLSALELILNNAFRHKLQGGQKVRVDAGDYRSRREDELADLAYQVAHSAKESGRTQETQPLNPYERRLVHLALAEDPSVTTRSRGSDFLKNVQVIPNRGGGQGRRG